MRKDVSLFLAAVALLFAAPLQAAIYYVSPTGSDSNSGTDPAQPWKTVSKVNATTFAPGSQILFQRGGEWHESLVPKSSGTDAAPITFADYGSTTLAKPEFIGSDNLQKNNFTPVAATASTYSMPLSAPWVGSVLSDHQFMREADLVDPAHSPLSVVNSTPNTWYYDSAQSRLYVNTGGASPAADSHTYSAVTREDAIYIADQNHINVTNLVTNETARYNSGYGIRLGGANQITLTNCESYAGGKHGIGVINSDAFVGNGLVVANLMPDQGYGGSTAFVSYSDINFANTPTTSQWLNCTAVNIDPAYPAFLNHGEGLKSVTIRNMTAAGAGISLGGTQQTSYLQGALITGGGILGLDGNVIADSVRIVGGINQVTVGGSGNILQNSVISGGDLGKSYQTIILDTSSGGNIFRFNTLVNDGSYAYGSVLAFTNSNAGDLLFGNLIASPHNFLHSWSTGTLNLTSDQNLFTSILSSGTTTHDINWATWLAQGQDVHSLLLDPYYLGLLDGTFNLPVGSPPATPISQADLIALNNWLALARPTGLIDDPNAFWFSTIPEPSSLLLLTSGILFFTRRRSPRIKTQMPRVQNPSLE